MNLWALLSFVLPKNAKSCSIVPLSIRNSTARYKNQIPKESTIIRVNFEFKKRQKLSSMSFVFVSTTMLIEKRAWKKEHRESCLVALSLPQIPLNQLTCWDENMRHDSIRERSRNGDIEVDASDGVNLNIWINMIYYLNVINNISHRRLSWCTRWVISRKERLDHARKVNVCLKITSCHFLPLMIFSLAWVSPQFCEAKFKLP